MAKGVMIIALVLMTGVAFVGGVWGEKNSPPGAFSGTIIKVDPTNKEIGVQNNDAEAIFRWNDATAVKGPGEKSLIFEDLKEGMTVTVLFRERGSGNRIAERIDVKAANLKTLKGMEFPFECGVTVC